MITKDTIIADVIEKYPKSIEVFAKHGLRCIGCGGALHESVEHGALLHGIDVEVLVKELNELTK